MKHFPLLFSFLVLGSLHQATAQSIGPATLNATGGSTAISGNTYEYAIGGISGNAFISSSLVVTPGVLQPVAGQPNGITTPGIGAALLQIYPNPADLILFLQPNFGSEGTLDYVLYDALGRKIAQRELHLSHGDERQEIRMSSFAAGQYTLNVSWQQQGKKYTSAYKIQKIK